MEGVARKCNERPCRHDHGDSGIVSAIPDLISKLLVLLMVDELARTRTTKGKDVDGAARARGVGIHRRSKHGSHLLHAAVYHSWGGSRIAKRLSPVRDPAALRKQHEETEHILSSGLPPESWSARYRRLVNFFSGIGVSGPALQRLKDFAKDRLENRLLALINYFERSNVVTDEGARDELTSRLRWVGRQWEQSNYEDLIDKD